MSSEFHFYFTYELRTEFLFYVSLYICIYANIQAHYESFMFFCPSVCVQFSLSAKPIWTRDGVPETHELYIFYFVPKYPLPVCLHALLVLWSYCSRVQFLPLPFFFAYQITKLLLCDKNVTAIIKFSKLFLRACQQKRLTLIKPWFSPSFICWINIHSVRLALLAFSVFC